MGIEIVNDLPQETWRLFVESHPNGNIFHTPEMYQVFNATKGYRAQLWAATDGGRILAMMMPVRVTLLNGIMKYFTTRNIAYGSVLCVPGLDGIKALNRLLKAFTVEYDGISLFTELRNISDLSTYQPVLQEYGFLFEDHLNYIIDLKRPSEQIMQSFGRRARKNLRRELRRGLVTIKPVNDLNGINACYDLILKTYSSANLPLADRSLFHSAFEILGCKSMVRFTLAYVENSPAAVSVDLLFKKVMYGWFGGLDRFFGSYMPNDILTWHLFTWGTENGYQSYDFGGAGKPDEKYGVRDFKAKFGGELVCYGRNTCIHSPIFLNISKFGYRLLRSLY